MAQMTQMEREEPVVFAFPAESPNGGRPANDKNAPEAAPLYGIGEIYGQFH